MFIMGDVQGPGVSTKNPAISGKSKLPEFVVYGPRIGGKMPVKKPDNAPNSGDNTSLYIMLGLVAAAGAYFYMQ